MSYIIVWLGMVAAIAVSVLLTSWQVVEVVAAVWYSGASLLGHWVWTRRSV